MEIARERSRVVTRVTLVALTIFLLLLVMDYFTAAELQVDLNRPRFRLVRHRMILPDQEFELEWKHISRWALSPEESPPVFGQQVAGGRYAWEIRQTGGSRFEDVYSELGSDAFLRTNVFVFQLDTSQMFKPAKHWNSIDEWATNHLR